MLSLSMALLPEAYPALMCADSLPGDPELFHDPSLYKGRRCLVGLRHRSDVRLRIMQQRQGKLCSRQTCRYMAPGKSVNWCILMTSRESFQMHLVVAENHLQQHQCSVEADVIDLNLQDLH